MEPLRRLLRQFRHLPGGGATLIEVLVTILILAFGLTGLAALHVKLQGAQYESFQRAQALLLVQDMANRISVNRVDAASYVTVAPLGTGDAQPASCAGLAGVAKDHCEWSRAIKGAAEQQDGAQVGAILAARGCIDQVGANPPVYRVTVAWQAQSEMAPPGVPCAAGAYPRETLRRVMSNFVAVANLEG